MSQYHIILMCKKVAENAWPQSQGEGTYLQPGPSVVEQDLPVVEAAKLTAEAADGYFNEDE